MIDKKEKYQQQILFEEADVLIGNSKENIPQVIVENQDWQPEVESENAAYDMPLEKRKPRWLWRIVSALFLSLVGIEAVQFFVEGFSQSPVIAGMYAALLGGVSLITGRAVWREWSGFRQFKRQEDIKQQAHALMKDESQINAMELCDKISEKLPCDIVSEEDVTWQALDHQEFNDVEILTLYSRNVLSKVDQKAMAEIAKFSTESVVLVALSPIAVIDMLLMLWRNLRLVNKIASLYGLKLGYWSRVKLIKQVIVNMAYAGASELVADLGADLIGADMLGKLSARMAQGLGAGMLTARLGLRTMHLCRPIPFKDDAPNLNQVRKQIAGQIKALVTK